MRLLLVAIVIFLVNLPFGYWRANVKKFSVQWFLSIHLPVPFVVLARIVSEIGFHWTTYPILVGAFFMGQLTGGKIYRWWIKKGRRDLTSNLLRDAVRWKFSHN